jgi:hypothetical protein
MNLTATQRQQLHTALLSAFPHWNDLRVFTDHYLDLNLATIATGTDLQTAAHDLIVWARKEGRVAELLAALGTARPQHPTVKVCCAWLPADGSSTAPAASTPPTMTTAARDRLEARINELDPPSWAALLTTLGLDPSLVRSQRTIQTEALLQQWVTEGWPGLEAAVQVQVTRQATAQAAAARDEEIAALWEQLKAAAQEEAWGTVIAQGEALLQLGRAEWPLTSATANGYYQRATFAAVRQDYVSALADYTRAIELADDNALYYHARSTVHCALGQTAEAEADAAQAHRRDPAHYGPPPAQHPPANNAPT